DYFIRATYSIDDLVVDPDGIFKFGEPKVTIVAENNTSATIKITEAVFLTSPVIQDGIPVEVSPIPTLDWGATNISPSDWVVEVVDANGQTVWGGFADDENSTKLVKLPKEQKSVEYNYDNMGDDLIPGKIYRWKVYASADASFQQEPLGWKLISTSEDALGIFKVVAP
ncbi:MAG: hypothetical protein V3S80_03905, partial [Sulfurimonadaceae bacterium]